MPDCTGSSIPAGEWLKSARKRLADQFPQSDPNENGLAAQVLLAGVFHQNRSWVLAHPEAQISERQQAELETLLRKLLEGMPLPYLLGQWEFYGLGFEVSPDVLIPRPETELLVERALRWLQEHPTQLRTADVGTGSGIIATVLAKHHPQLQVLAVDRSWQALQVARRNAARHGVSAQVQFVQSDLLRAASGPFDLVCANLPYIPAAEVEELAVSKFEPRAALDGGSDGLEFIHALLRDAPRWLACGGLLLLEMQFDQGEAIHHMAKAQFPGASIRVLPDLAGLPRLVEVEIISCI